MDARAKGSEPSEERARGAGGVLLRPAEEYGVLARGGLPLRIPHDAHVASRRGEPLALESIVVPVFRAPENVPRHPTTDYTVSKVALSSHIYIRVG